MSIAQIIIRMCLTTPLKGNKEEKDGLTLLKSDLLPNSGMLQGGFVSHGNSRDRIQCNSDLN